LPSIRSLNWAQKSQIQRDIGVIASLVKIALGELMVPNLKDKALWR
jgi:hypothetical protein